MALTPDEVVNKTFQPTKFREGYDQDEVDDFLDEVVNELRRLLTENDDLRQKLSACESRVGELTRQGTAASSAPAVLDKQAPTPEPVPEPVAAPTPPPAPTPEPRPEPVRPAAAAPAAVSAPAVSAPAPVMAGAGPEAATGMLALAQKLHDEHVRSGEEQRDRLVADAQTHAGRLVSEAEEKKAQTLGSLEQERSLLERKIDELRSFERDYRNRLKSYLETQLRDLESKATVVPGRGGDSNPLGGS